MSSQQSPSQTFIENLRGRVLGDKKAVTLVIGEIARWAAQGRTTSDVADLTYVEFDELSHETVTAVEPDVILSPLVTDAFDAFQIVKYLESFGFQGRYRVIAPPLPNLAMVRAEVKAAAPDIDFDILEMPPTLVSVT